MVEDQDATDDLLARIDAERASQVVIRRLGRLPPFDRSVVELVDLAGLTPKEAALALGISAGTLRVRLFRARARLRREDQK